MKIEIVYAGPQQVFLKTLDMEDGATIEAAIHKSGVLSRHPEINLEKQKVGVYSRPKALDSVLSAGDRVEIYRPIVADLNKLLPKEGDGLDSE